jgi:hypothetical protein
MKAELLLRRKVIYKDGAVLEMVLWKLPSADQERPHGLKYRLYYGFADGTCQIRYDNERGKGDHRHYGKQEESYFFTNVETLIEDFMNDVHRYRGEK